MTQRASSGSSLGSVYLAKGGLAAMGLPDPEIRYNMRDLSGLFAGNVLNLSLDRLTGQWPGPQTWPEAAMWINFVRLTDRALHTHEQARSHLNSYRNAAHAGRVGPYYLAIDELEACITATLRAVLNAERIDSTGAYRQLLGATPKQRQSLRLCRNHVEHMDDKLTRRQVRAGELYQLVPLANRMHIGSVGMSYRDLASVITKMYRNIELIRRAPNA